VLLVDRDWMPGGSLLPQPDGAAEAERLVAGARMGGVEILLGATAIGEFEEGVEGVVTAAGLLAVRAMRTVRATGTRDRELSLPDGDRPGVMLAGAVRRLVVREGVRPGRRAVIVAPGDGPDLLSSLLRDAGVAVVARCAPPAVEAIHGRSSVAGVTIAGRRLSCDLVVIDAGRRPADELARQADIPEEPRVG
jgi:sarcosine oxidase, subunit alpha